MISNGEELISLATRNGNLAAALSLVNNQPVNQVQEWMLKAGFSTSGTHDEKRFWREVQSDLARACAARTDGYGLRNRAAQPLPPPA